MKCPHCLVTIHPSAKSIGLGADADGSWVLKLVPCPACKRYILSLACGKPYATENSILVTETLSYLVHPKVSGRPPCPPEVPADIAGDYKEACLVLGDSPKASAALSRRCLQGVLRNAAGVKQGDLVSEIQQLLGSGKLPTALAENIDAIRNIGNFAAHPLKSTATGQIVDVEAGEAEWNLDVLEQLFDFYYVGPALAKQKRDALNAKLATLGKPPMKQ